MESVGILFLKLQMDFRAHHDPCISPFSVVTNTVLQTVSVRKKDVLFCQRLYGYKAVFVKVFLRKWSAFVSFGLSYKATKNSIMKSLIQ